MEKSTATLIRTSRLTETSLIVHWCGGDCGLLKTVAKGALRSNSKFVGKLDLFFEAEIVWARAKGDSDLHTLSEVHLLLPREHIRASWLNTLAAACFVRWIEIVAERETPIEDLSDLLRRALDYLDQKKADLRAVRHFEKQLAQLTGVYRKDRSPDLDLQAAFGQMPKQREELMQRVT